MSQSLYRVYILVEIEHDTGPRLTPDQEKAMAQIAAHNLVSDRNGPHNLYFEKLGEEIPAGYKIKCFVSHMQKYQQNGVVKNELFCKTAELDELRQQLIDSDPPEVKDEPPP